MHIHRLRGLITSVGFESGDRFVVGNWLDGPIGPMNDVMWADRSGKRTLIAPTRQVADFVSAVYSFEEILIEPVQFDVADGTARLHTDTLDITYSLGRRIPIPFGRLRPLTFTRYVEGPIARIAMGVNTHGTSNTGVREWYCADSYRRVTQATATRKGSDLGEMHDIRPPLGVGFSEPPPKPSMVAVRPALQDPSGKLDKLLKANQECGETSKDE